MTLYKRGTCRSSVVVSSSVYACTNCDNTQIVKDDDVKEKKCSRCGSMMRIISSQAEVTGAGSSDAIIASCEDVDKEEAETETEDIEDTEKT